MPNEKVIAELQHQFSTTPATSADIEDAMLNKLGLHGDGTKPFVEVAESFLTAISKQSSKEQLSSLNLLARPLAEAVWVFDDESDLSLSYRKTLDGFTKLALALLGSSEMKMLPQHESFQSAGSCLSILAASAGQSELAEMLQQSNLEIRCSNSDCSEYMADEIKCPKCGSYSSPESMFVSASYDG